MTHNSENISPLSSEPTFVTSYKSSCRTVSEQACNLSVTPSPSYGSERSSMESFASSDLPSLHSEVASEYSSVLSTIASSATGVHSSVSTHHPSVREQAQFHDRPSSSAIPSLVNSEDADLIDYALRAHEGEAQGRRSTNDDQPSPVAISLSPISLSTEVTQSLPINEPARRRVAINLVHPPRVVYPALRRSNAMPGYYEGQCGSPSSSGFETPSIDASSSPMDNSYRSRFGRGSPLPNGFNPTSQSKTDGITSNGTLASLPSSHSAALNSTFNVEDRTLSDGNTSDREGEMRRKRPKRGYEPRQRAVNDSSPDDISVHSFKLRRLRGAVFSHRAPDLGCDSPVLHSVDVSSSADLDSSQCPLTISARTSSSFLISSGDSSRDDALLSMSVARAFSGSASRVPLHCPTPMTNASSPTLKTDPDNSRLELSNSSEENAGRDDEIIRELTALAFVKAGPRRGCLVDSAATSVCSSPKVKKRVRFNNVPFLIRRSTQDSSPECKPSPSVPVIRHTRSSQLRAQFVRQRQLNAAAANQRASSEARSRADLKRNRQDALISPASGSSSAILSPSRVPKKVFRK